MRVDCVADLKVVAFWILYKILYYVLYSDEINIFMFLYTSSPQRERQSPDKSSYMLNCIFCFVIMSNKQV